MSTDGRTLSGASSKAVLALAWLAVGLPLLWGVAMTVSKAALLFH